MQVGRAEVRLTWLVVWLAGRLCLCLCVMHAECRRCNIAAAAAAAHVNNVDVVSMT